jgi:hypothetical protein
MSAPIWGRFSTGLIGVLQLEGVAPMAVTARPLAVVTHDAGGHGRFFGRSSEEPVGTAGGTLPLGEVGRGWFGRERRRRW